MPARTRLAPRVGVGADAVPDVDRLADVEHVAVGLELVDAGLPREVLGALADRLGVHRIDASGVERYQGDASAPNGKS